MLQQPARAVRSSAAFTLIELLVVISIIALLIGILLPALGAARESAQLAACLSNARQATLGLVTYATDFDGDVPPARWPGRNRFGDPVTFGNAQLEASWNRDFIAPMLLGRDFPLNPSGFEDWKQVMRRGEVFACPVGGDRVIPSTGKTVREEDNPFLWGCGMNGLFGVSKEQVANAQAGIGPFANPSQLIGSFKNIEQVRDAASTMLLLESISRAEYHLRWLAGNSQPVVEASGAEHHDAVTTAYGDGHASSLPFDEITEADPALNPVWDTFWLGG